jgi:hypothetical protein
VHTSLGSSIATSGVEPILNFYTHLQNLQGGRGNRPAAARGPAPHAWCHHAVDFDLIGLSFYPHWGAGSTVSLYAVAECVRLG